VPPDLACLDGAGVLEGALALPQFTEKKRDYFAAKWIPQGWQWVDPKKEFDAMLTAIRAGLLSRSEAISAFGYDAEDIDREIAADNQRADELGLVFDSDPRHDKAPQPPAPMRPPRWPCRKTTGQLTCNSFIWRPASTGRRSSLRVPNST
jgi:capsid protein